MTVLSSLDAETFYRVWIALCGSWWFARGRLADREMMMRFRVTMRGLSCASRSLRAALFTIARIEADRSRALIEGIRELRRRSGGRIRDDADLSSVAGPF